jgi:hypothetical protein
MLGQIESPKLTLTSSTSTVNTDVVSFPCMYWFRSRLVWIRK